MGGGSKVVAEAFWFRQTIYPRSAMDSGPKGIRFVIATAHPIFRDGLRSLLGASQNFQVVGEATEGAEAVKLARELKPDILLLDLAMPRYSGLAALRDLASSPTSPRIIAFIADIDRAQVAKVLQLGARAVVLKEQATKVLIPSIHSLLAGQYWVGHESAASLAQALRNLRTFAREDQRHKEFGLTPRELDIVEMIVSAHRNRDIAEKFSISEDTVKRHLTHIFNKLDVSSRLELALFAIDHRLGRAADGGGRSSSDPAN